MDVFGQLSGITQCFLPSLQIAMLQKTKSLLTSAHCEEWDNEMQNQSRTQGLCLFEPGSVRGEDTHPEKNTQLLVSTACARGLILACEEDAALIPSRSRAKPGTFLHHPPHSSIAWCFSQQNMQCVMCCGLNFLVRNTASLGLCREPGAGAKCVTPDEK